jgi:hypothetical protein
MKLVILMSLFLAFSCAHKHVDHDPAKCAAKSGKCCKGKKDAKCTKCDSKKKKSCKKGCEKKCCTKKDAATTT